MVMNTDERRELEAMIADYERTAAGLPEASALRSALYRHAATLRAFIAKALVSRPGRVDGHPC